jgi:anti-sigma factor RsiW
VADLYVLDRLTPAEAETFEEHFLLCPACAEKAELAFEFSAAIRKYHA